MYMGSKGMIWGSYVVFRWWMCILIWPQTLAWQRSSPIIKNSTTLYYTLQHIYASSALKVENTHFLQSTLQNLQTHAHTLPHKLRLVQIKTTTSNDYHREQTDTYTHTCTYTHTHTEMCIHHFKMFSPMMHQLFISTNDCNSNYKNKLRTMHQ